LRATVVESNCPSLLCKKGVAKLRRGDPVQFQEWGRRTDKTNQDCRPWRKKRTRERADHKPRTPGKGGDCIKVSSFNVKGSVPYKEMVPLKWIRSSEMMVYSTCQHVLYSYIKIKRRSVEKKHYEGVSKQNCLRSNSPQGGKRL